MIVPSGIRFSTKIKTSFIFMAKNHSIHATHEFAFVGNLGWFHKLAVVGRATLYLFFKQCLYLFAKNFIYVYNIYFIYNIIYVSYNIHVCIWYNPPTSSLGCPQHIPFSFHVTLFMFHTYFSYQVSFHLQRQLLGILGIGLHPRPSLRAPDQADKEIAWEMSSRGRIGILYRHILRCTFLGT